MKNIIEKVFCNSIILIFTLLILLPEKENYSQNVKLSDVNKIFIHIEDGLNNNAVDKFAGYFSEKNFISLKNGNSGYFSANQSFYVIKDFLSIYKPISFKLTNIVTDSVNPFASGILKYNNNGIRGTAIVFISLQLVNNQWRISQITIN
ncbi:MAG: DUF4783 domain-containing protein [Melioribacteraceae bacterium]